MRADYVPWQFERFGPPTSLSSPLDDGMSLESDNASVFVVGFVKTPGRYSYKEGMTVENALDQAGGYATCDSCQAYWQAARHHPTYDNPPRVERAGRPLELPNKRREWGRFILEPDDEIKFPHIDW
jgi:protein involved in polysaccharide export with SLBB domain